MVAGGARANVGQPHGAGYLDITGCRGCSVAPVAEEVSTPGPCMGSSSSTNPVIPSTTLPRENMQFLKWFEYCNLGICILSWQNRPRQHLNPFTLRLLPSKCQPCPCVPGGHRCAWRLPAKITRAQVCFQWHFVHLLYIALNYSKGSARLKWTQK